MVVASGAGLEVSYLEGVGRAVVRAAVPPVLATVCLVINTGSETRVPAEPEIRICWSRTIVVALPVMQATSVAEVAGTMPYPAAPKVGAMESDGQETPFRGTELMPDTPAQPPL